MRTPLEASWNLDLIGAPEAKTNANGPEQRQGVTIAVVDTGIDYNHIEFKDALERLRLR